MQARFGAWEGDEQVPLPAGERAALEAHEGRNVAMRPLVLDAIAVPDDAALYRPGERLPMLYGDLDADRCMDEVAALRCIEHARSIALLKVLRQVGLYGTPDGLKAPLASKRVRFMTHRRAPEAVESWVVAGRVGHTSIDVRCIADGRQYLPGAIGKCHGVHQPVQ